MNILKRILQAEFRRHRWMATDMLIHLRYLSFTDMG